MSTPTPVFGESATELGDLERRFEDIAGTPYPLLCSDRMQTRAFSAARTGGLAPRIRRHRPCLLYLIGRNVDMHLEVIARFITGHLDSQISARLASHDIDAVGVVVERMSLVCTDGLPRRLNV